MLCSPAAAGSRWVNQEILEFKRLGRADRILALIVEGEPNAADPALECFPPALKYVVDAYGQLSEEHAEPIAADLRPQGDGRDNAKLKLIAGLLGASFNDLRQRELIAARRRVRIYQGIAAAMVLLAALAVGGGWMAWRYAKQSEARLGQAVDIAASFVTRAVRLGDSFGVPRSAIEELLTQADAAFAQLLQEGTRSDRLRSRHALLLMVFADHYGIIGKTDRQWDAAQRASDILQELVADHPSNPEWLRQLAISHDLVGDILADRFQLDTALVAYRAAQSIREKLSADDPRDASSERDLVLSDNKVGDMLFRQGHPEEALAAFQAAREISDRLARAHPENLEWQRDVLVIHHKIGDVLAKKGDLNGAGEAYRASLLVAERLAAGDPSNAQLQRDLSASQEKVGNVLAAQGDVEAALAAFRASLALTERLAAADPTNVTIQRDLSLGHANVGRILSKQHQTDAALDCFPGLARDCRATGRRQSEERAFPAGSICGVEQDRRQSGCARSMAGCARPLSAIAGNPRAARRATTHRALHCNETYRLSMIVSPALWQSRAGCRRLSRNSRSRSGLPRASRHPIRAMPRGDAISMRLIGIWASFRSAGAVVARRGRRIAAPRKSFRPSPR